MKAKPYKSNILATCIALSLWGSVQAMPDDCNNDNFQQQVLELAKQVKELYWMLEHMLITQNDEEDLLSSIKVATRENDDASIRRLVNTPVLGKRVKEIIRTSSFYLLRKAIKNNSTETLNALIEAGANIYAESEYGETLLHIATRHCVEVVRALIDAGMDVNKTIPNDGTPLHIAVGCDKKEIVRVFIKHGSDMNAKRCDQSTPLHWVRSTEVLAELLEAGAQINARDCRGYTPLHSLCKKEHHSPNRLSLLHALIEGGADIRATDSEGRTPLHVFCMQQFLSSDSATFAKILIKKSADIHARDKDGRTPLSYVKEDQDGKEERTKIINYLESKGATE